MSCTTVHVFQTNPSHFRSFISITTVESQTALQLVLQLLTSCCYFHRNVSPKSPLQNGNFQNQGVTQTSLETAERFYKILMLLGKRRRAEMLPKRSCPPRQPKPLPVMGQEARGHTRCRALLCRATTTVKAGGSRQNWWEPGGATCFSHSQYARHPGQPRVCAHKQRKLQNNVNGFCNL